MQINRDTHKKKYEGQSTWRGFWVHCKRFITAENNKREWVSTPAHTHTHVHSIVCSFTTSAAEPVWVKVTLPSNHLSLRNSFNYGLCSLYFSLSRSLFLSLCLPITTHRRTHMHTHVHVGINFLFSGKLVGVLGWVYTCLQLQNNDVIHVDLIILGYFTYYSEDASI